MVHWNMSDFFEKIQKIQAINEILFGADKMVRDEFGVLYTLFGKADVDHLSPKALANELDTAIEITETMKNRLILQLMNQYEFSSGLSLPIYFVNRSEQLQHQIELSTDVTGEYIARIPLMQNYDVAVQLGSQFRCIQFDGLLIQKNIDDHSSMLLKQEEHFVFDDFVALNSKVIELGENGLIFFKHQLAFDPSSHILFRFRSILKK